MLSPLWVSHSRQAATHERQPIQREGSRKICFTVTVSVIIVLPSHRRTCPRDASGTWGLGAHSRWEVHGDVCVLLRAAPCPCHAPTPAVVFLAQPHRRRLCIPGSSSSALAPDWSGCWPPGCAHSDTG